ncbi:asparaginase [Pseudoroseicyclus tamaricis]|uniref:Asparaginase n=1 Tax=Pseudoroseicyclus tamaricis TaxID=2705421 RepID=A0A6B2JNZ2_9RHOB|nr:asparaginase [Pseudoroseicyclus tamaricis]NDU99654.1 asparaginase [Pseudoroseicyclus tamaricis]
MAAAVDLVELWRGGRMESVHAGHVVIANAAGEVVEAHGDANAVIYPRSAVKMIQALPLIESGAADAAGLTTEQLALSGASHRGAAIHTERVTAWLAELGLGEPDLRCGAHMPENREARYGLIRGHEEPCQIHNNCSGKHSGFLTLTKHLGAGPEYIEIDHPVQKAVREAFEDVTGRESPGYGIDGCSAPNFACRLGDLARGMARFAAAPGQSGRRPEAMTRIAEAMRTHPELIADEGAACTELMRACGGQVTLKGGAEGVYTAILPEQGLGVALKISDGATRAAEAAIAGVLAGLGVLDRASPAYQGYAEAKLINCRGIPAAEIRLAPALR